MLCGNEMEEVEQARLGAIGGRREGILNSREVNSLGENEGVCVVSSLPFLPSKTNNCPLFPVLSCELPLLDKLQGEKVHVPKGT